MSALAPVPSLDDLRRLAENSDVMNAVRRFYQHLDDEIASRRPLCWQRGGCCKFDTFGHRLFVTTLELAYFMHVEAKPALRRPTEDRCPYQVGNRCTARTGRPLGCRVFFCEPVSQHWQHDLSEKNLATLSELHTRFGAPYAYVDWRTALIQLADVQSSLDTQPKAT